ncbi:MAG: TonB-dependent receptor [Byssovorax sp.]
MARGEDPPDPPASAAEVTVLGDRSPRSERDPSAASFVLREDRLKLPGQTAASALAEVPGVQVSRSGAGSDLATASIRGSEQRRDAGVPRRRPPQRRCHRHRRPRQVPLWISLKRVEVFRGNAPADADRLGIGGAIFFEPLLPRGTKVGLGLGLGSFGEASGRVFGSFGDARGGAMIALQHQGAQNDYRYVDTLRTTVDPGDAREQIRENADFTATDLWSLGRWRIGRGSITAIASGFTRDQGVTGLTLDPAKAARSHVQRWLGALTSVLPCATGETGADRCRVELGTSAVLAGRDIDDPRGELGLTSRRVSSRGARIGELARLRYRIGERWSLTGSAGQEFETLDITQDLGAPLHASRNVTRGAASATFTPIDALDLHGLAAIEHHGTNGVTPLDTTQPAARLGARLRLGEALALTANLGRYVRVPTLGELYGISPVVLGNASLSPEQGASIDAGAQLTLGSGDASFFAEAFAFSRFASDLVTYKQSVLGVVRPYNTKSARILGLEVAAGAQLFRHVRADLSLTLLDPRDTSAQTSQLVPYQARVVAVPSIEVFHGPVRALVLDRIGLGARVAYRSELRVDPTGSMPRIPSQATLDLWLRLLFSRGRLAADLRLENLTATRTADVLGLPLPGRSVHGSLEVTW